jgi:hypothetical protein
MTLLLAARRAERAQDDPLGSPNAPSAGVTKPRLEDLNSMAAIVWKGFVSFGLVSFPVRLFAAARAEAVPPPRSTRPRSCASDPSGAVCGSATAPNTRDEIFAHDEAAHAVCHKHDPLMLLQDVGQTQVH